MSWISSIKLEWVDQAAAINRLSRSWNIPKLYSSARIIRDYKGAVSWKRRAFNLATIGRFRRKSVGRDIFYRSSDIEFIIKNLDMEL